VLIVNLWEHQIGLYQGANMGLLKTVFEVNLGLFGKAGACVIPFPYTLVPDSRDALERISARCYCS
jgi:hypothetical protein